MLTYTLLLHLFYTLLLHPTWVQIYVYVYIYTIMYTYIYIQIYIPCFCILFLAMEWLRLVDSFKLKVSFAKEPYKRDYILQKRPMILRSLVIVATPYEV